MEISKEYVMKLLSEVIGEIEPCTDSAIECYKPFLLLN